MGEYLSLDLDYFFCKYPSKKFNECKLQEAESLLQTLLSLNVPVNVVEYHDCLLDYVDSSIHQKVYNVDFHSDIAHNYDNNIPLNEGTWLNFITNSRNVMDFQWNYPDHRICVDQGWGLCDMYPEAWATQYMPFNKIEKYEGLKNISYSNITEVGISISPDWSDMDACNVIFKKFPSIFRRYT